MRDQFGKCTVHSGHRSLAHNRAVHGAVKSVHLLRSRLPNASGLAAAADVSFARGSVAEWEDMAVLLRGTQPHLAERGRGGIGRYDRAGFVHLDTWTWRTWSG